MLQTRFNIQNDPCDDTLLAIVAVLNVLSFIVRMVGSESNGDACEQLTECVNASVCACMLTQHDIQIKAIEENWTQNPYGGMNQQVLLALPPQQQEMVQGFAQLKPSAPVYGATGMNPSGALPPQ